MTNKEIENSARALWEKYVKQGNAHTYFRQMMAGENIKYRTLEDKNQNFLGAFTRSPKGQLYIMVNSSIGNEGRRNYTIAHELGHYALHHPLHGGSLLCGTSSINEEGRLGNGIEKEANYFAACLLMPKDKIKSAFCAQLRRQGFVTGNSVPFTINTKNYGVWCKIKSRFMNRYGVSETALRFRLISLNLAVFDF